MARILVVDNDPGFVRMAKGVLQTDGYQVQVAMDRSEALNLMEHAVPDLVLLDDQTQCREILGCDRFRKS